MLLLVASIDNVTHCMSAVSLMFLQVAIIVIVAAGREYR
jgi:hypothetical protein